MKIGSNTKTRKNSKSKQNKSKKRVFKTTDYNAPDGFLTSVWGPALWHTLHTISFNYPSEGHILVIFGGQTLGDIFI